MQEYSTSSTLPKIQLRQFFDDFSYRFQQEPSPVRCVNPDMAIMQRLTICGNSGAGKSTFAEALGLASRLPVFHLDLIQFQPGWQKTSPAAFEQQHKTWLQESTWIIEGVGDWQPLKSRFSAADTILYLDFPVEYCLQKARERLEKDRISPNPFVPENSPYAAKADKLEEVIHFFHREWRPKILRLMENLREGRNLYVFTQPDGLAEFLLEVKSELSG